MENALEALGFIALVLAIATHIGGTIYACSQVNEHEEVIRELHARINALEGEDFARRKRKR